MSDTPSETDSAPEDGAADNTASTSDQGDGGSSTEDSGETASGGATPSDDGSGASPSDGGESSPAGGGDTTSSGDDSGTSPTDDGGTSTANDSGSSSTDDAASSSSGDGEATSGDSGGTSSGDDSGTPSTDDGGTSAPDDSGTTSGDGGETASADDSGTSSASDNLVASADDGKVRSPEDGGSSSTGRGGPAGGNTSGGSSGGGSGSGSAQTGSGSTATSSADPGAPYLMVDLYSGDDERLTGKAPNWATLAKTKNFVGAILKAWDGVSFNDGGWFGRHWPAVRAAGGSRYGDTWFRGAYLFLEFAKPGADQADAYLAAVDKAGGWDSGDLLPIVDIERGFAGRPAKDGKPAIPAHANQSASNQQIIDCAVACVKRVKDKTGRRVMLYGRTALDPVWIKTKMGFDAVWNPAWTRNMVTTSLDAFALEDIVLWQYCGDGQSAALNLPNSVSGFGATDISVFVKGSQKPNIQMVRDNLLK